MSKIRVTGMSGTGKSTVLRELARRGHRVVDTDDDVERWHHWVRRRGTRGTESAGELVWREDAISTLLAGHHAGALFLSGTVSNQGRFYPFLDHVVLLSAPREVLLARIEQRTDNPYGKSPEQRALVLQHLHEVEPRLRATATLEIDTSGPLEGVVERLEALASRPVDTPPSV